ncbi:hypothetical protein PSAL_004740 [Pseudooceanicola algae]|uniref:D-galactarate dehydratase n=2 Tax=Pseudooceanicola algae TaxID=1537215 RepID=A0A418SF82_9RHOB|nr:hypothetical protein PSAL_004740 [Pseudooceanicola algae]
MILRPLLLSAPLFLAACNLPIFQADPAPTGLPAARIAEEPAGMVEQADGAVQSGQLGSTLATLGAATEAGLWLKTPLVTKRQPGEVYSAQTGKRLAVDLIPIEGPATGGSRLSLQAMQQLGLSLTSLAEVDVSA